MTFFCCGSGGDRNENVPPSRPVELGKTSGKEKTEKKSTVPTQSHTPPAQQVTAGLSTAGEKQGVFGHPESSASGSSNMPGRTYAPPSGPPPGRNTFEPPADPPSHQPDNGTSGPTIYTPPAGPPPGYQNDGTTNTSGLAENPPPYHNWQEAVPDTSLFPPPPIGGFLYSNTGNASEEDADRAHAFCDNSPLWIPYKPSSIVYSSVQNHDLRPVKPNEYNGSLDLTGPGRWSGRTRDRNGDCLLLTSLPLYFPTEDSPLVTERTKTIYFEVKLVGLYQGTDNQTPGFSIGFAAQPYPTWRSPGWERGSVGVFSDDGCRFVNDSWGGREFTTEFKPGETVGLGMKFSLPDDAAIKKAQETPGKSPALAVEIFFTRNGQIAGSWDLHEEVDEEAGGVGGLEGDYDLYGALGLFGGVSFETCFDPAGWLWVPPS